MSREPSEDPSPGEGGTPRSAGVQWCTRGPLRFACYDVHAFEDAYREVFDEGVYRFAPAADRPFIIDAGANLGLATCYFKTRHPDAEVLAFEPDPRLADLYERNVEVNGMEITPVMATFAGALRPASFAF